MNSRLQSWLSLLIPRRRAEWSIGMYVGSDPLHLAPHPDLAAGLALGRRNFKRAQGVADPFLVFEDDTWLLFFELENADSGRGEIALASSTDAIRWKVEGTVLREPFHLSYPHVFRHEGRWYMVPESAADRVVRLYVTDEFPRGWRRHADLLHGDYVDATPFMHEGRWWMFALQGWNARDALVVFHADRLEGPWMPHALNPLRTAGATRPAGRVMRYAGHLLRLAQEGEPNYGRRVRAFAIESLTPDTYEEREIGAGRALVDATGKGWNATGMHHIDACELRPGQWVAAVDGRRTRIEWPLASRFVARLRGALPLATRFRRLLSNLPLYRRVLGWRGIVDFARIRYTASKHALPVHLRGCAHAIWLRPHSTDVETFREIFLTEDYSTAGLAGSLRSVIDAGANIGLASVYFANRFPQARILAVEPEGANFELLCRNVAPYAQVTPLCAAVWGHSGSLMLHDPGRGAHGFITGAGSPAALPLGTVAAFGIDDLMRKMSWQTLDLLKLDVEGAEKEVFETSAPWMAAVRAVMVELHERLKPGCTQAFEAATGHMRTLGVRGKVWLKAAASAGDAK